MGFISEHCVKFHGKPVRICAEGDRKDDFCGTLFSAEALAGDWFLVECYAMRDGVSSDTVSRYQIARAPFRTNQSHQPLESGWLGSYSDGSRGTDRWAAGRVRLTVKNGKISIRRMKA